MRVPESSIQVEARRVTLKLLLSAKDRPPRRFLEGKAK